MSSSSYFRSSTFVAVAVLALFSSPVSSAPTRTLRINNYCPSTVWFKATPGSAPFVNPSVTRCSSDADCSTGSHCTVGEGTPLCFMNTPEPTSGRWRVEPGQSNSMVFPFYDNGHDAFWSGNVRGCVDSTCSDPSQPFTTSGVQAYCDSNGCGPPGGSPVNLAEWTWSKSGLDYYDISIINGVNLGMEMYPVLSRNRAPAGAFTSDPYRCGNAGGVIPTTGTGHATWKFTVTDKAYKHVLRGGNSCRSDSDCGGGTLCGLSDNVGQIPRFQYSCGIQKGYWTADQVCGTGEPFGAPFNCKSAITHLSPKSIASGQSFNTFNLLGCTGAGIDSCYQDGAQDTCCGCADWQDLFGSNVVPQQTVRCKNQNSEWTQKILPGLTWLKAGCPSCYTYPYDDHSSTFICSVTEGLAPGQRVNANVFDYQLNFCPQSKSFAGINEVDEEDGESDVTDFDDTTVNIATVNTLADKVDPSVDPKSGNEGQSPAQPVALIILVGITAGVSIFLGVALAYVIWTKKKVAAGIYLGVQGQEVQLPQSTLQSNVELNPAVVYPDLQTNPAVVMV